MFDLELRKTQLRLGRHCVLRSACFPARFLVVLLAVEAAWLQMNVLSLVLYWFDLARYYNKAVLDVKRISKVQSSPVSWWHNCGRDQNWEGYPTDLISLQNRCTLLQLHNTLRNCHQVYDHFNNLCRENAIGVVRAFRQAEQQCPLVTFVQTRCKVKVIEPLRYL